MNFESIRHGVWYCFVLSPHERFGHSRICYSEIMIYMDASATR